MGGEGVIRAMKVISTVLHFNCIAIKVCRRLLSSVNRLLRFACNKM